METEIITRSEKKISELNALFKPRSIAIIGASSRELSIGNVIIKNLLHYGYTGKIFPINPKESQIRGLRAYPSVSEVPDDIDLAHVIIPAPLVPQVIEECGRKGIRAVIINSAGFSEMGAEGEALQEAFLANARKYGIRIFGPNCQGIINCDPEYNAYCDFTFTFPKPGTISIVALSGGVGAVMMQSLFDLDAGMRLYASNGNACDVSISEVLQYYGEDEGTKVVMLYTEGLRDAKAFMEAANSVSARKPVLAMKAGRTEQGAQAAASHTGSLAGVDISTELIFEKTGVLSFHNEEDMCQAALAFASQPIPHGNKVGIITNTGGPAVIATDELVSAGLELQPLSERARSILKETLLPEASIGNPVDVVATGGAVHFRSALDVMMNELEIHSIFVNFVTAPFTDTDAVAREIVEVSNMRKKPIVCNFMTNMSMERYQATAKILKDGGVPCYAFPTTAAKALGAMYRYHLLRARNNGQPEIFPDASPAEAEQIILQARTAGREFLSSPEVYHLLSCYGIPVANWRIADDIKGAFNAALEVGYPLVVKAESANLLHKSDAGGVILNVKNADELRAAVEKLKSSFKENDLRFLIQQFLPGGRELVAGVTAQKGAGHLIMFGLGGIYVEVLRDVVFNLAPLTGKEADRMLGSIRSARLLDGVRGEKGVDRQSVVKILQRLSQLVCDNPSIAEMDLNPIMAFEKRACVVDARIRIHIK